MDTQMDTLEEEEEEEEATSEQIDTSKELEILKTALQRYGQKTQAVVFKKINLVIKVRCLAYISTSSSNVPSSRARERAYAADVGMCACVISLPLSSEDEGRDCGRERGGSGGGGEGSEEGGALVQAQVQSP